MNQNHYMKLNQLRDKISCNKNNLTFNEVMNMISKLDLQLIDDITCMMQNETLDNLLDAFGDVLQGYLENGDIEE